MRKLVIIQITLLSFWGCSSTGNHADKVVLAQKALTNGDLKQAASIFKKVLNENASNTDALLGMGDVYFSDLKIAKAKTQFKKVLAIDSLHIEANLKLAEIQIILGQYNLVFEHVNTALRQNAENAKGYFMKAVAYKHMGDTANAISSLRTANELSPENSDYCFELGLLLTFQNDPIALEYLKTGLQNAPNNSDLMNVLAWSYQIFGNYAAADKQYASLLRKNPNHIEGKLNWAVLKYNTFKNDTALVLVNEILQKEPANPAALHLKQLCLSD